MDELLDFDLASHGVTTQFTRPTSTYSIVFATNGAHVILPVASTSSALALDADTAAWVFEAARKLESLGKLRANWDSYGGLPLSQNAKRITFDALGWLKNQDLPVPAVVLGSAGTVHLEWKSKGKKLELGFGERGIDEYLKIDRQGNVEEAEDARFSDEEAETKLKSLAEWLRNA